MAEDRRRKPGRREEGSLPPISRRELLARTGKYSMAVLGVAFGSRTLVGCDDGDGRSEGDLCSNTCTYASDGECDDGGPGALYTVCDLGTDCDDCGPRPGGGYSDLYTDSYSNVYSDSYSNVYSDVYSDYPDYYSDFSNSW